MKEKKEKIAIKSAEDADQALLKIGGMEDFISLREIEFNAGKDALKARMVEQCGPLKKEIPKWIRALQKWADVVIEAPSSREGVRSRALNFGKVWFRWTPPAIKFKLEEESVIERLRARRMTSCIRTVESVNKEALEAYDDETLKAVGAYRDQDERFYYEVFKAEVK